MAVSVVVGTIPADSTLQPGNDTWEDGGLVHGLQSFRQATEAPEIPRWAKATNSFGTLDSPSKAARPVLPNLLAGPLCAAHCLPREQMQAWRSEPVPRTLCRMLSHIQAEAENCSDQQENRHWATGVNSRTKFPALLGGLSPRSRCSPTVGTCSGVSSCSEAASSQLDARADSDVPTIACLEPVEHHEAEVHENRAVLLSARAHDGDAADLSIRQPAREEQLHLMWRLMHDLKASVAEVRAEVAKERCDREDQVTRQNEILYEKLSIEAMATPYRAHLPSNIASVCKKVVEDVGKLRSSHLQDMEVIRSKIEDLQSSVAEVHLKTSCERSDEHHAVKNRGTSHEGLCRQRRVPLESASATHAAAFDDLNQKVKCFRDRLLTEIADAVQASESKMVAHLQSNVHRTENRISHCIKLVDDLIAQRCTLAEMVAGLQVDMQDVKADIADLAVGISTEQVRREECMARHDDCVYEELRRQLQCAAAALRDNLLMEVADAVQTSESRQIAHFQAKLEFLKASAPSSWPADRRSTANGGEPIWMGVPTSCKADAADVEGLPAPICNQLARYSDIISIHARLDSLHATLLSDIADAVQTSELRHLERAQVDRGRRELLPSVGPLWPDNSSRTCGLASGETVSGLVTHTGGVWDSPIEACSIIPERADRTDQILHQIMLSRGECHREAWEDKLTSMLKAKEADLQCNMDALRASFVQMVGQVDEAADAPTSWPVSNLQYRGLVEVPSATHPMHCKHELTEPSGAASLACPCEQVHESLLPQGSGMAESGAAGGQQLAASDGLRPTRSGQPRQVRAVWSCSQPPPQAYLRTAGAAAVVVPKKG